MNEDKARFSLKQLGNALQRLHEALQEPNTGSLVIDGTIQRFEFVVELYWKTLKRLLASEGIQTHTPRETLERAYQAEWLKDEKVWLRMLKDRNETSLMYDEEAAVKIYNHIKHYYPELERTYRFLREKFI